MSATSPLLAQPGLGWVVRTLRLDARVTVEQVAAQAGVSVPQIIRVEAGRQLPTAAWLGVVTEAILRAKEAVR